MTQFSRRAFLGGAAAFGAALAAPRIAFADPTSSDVQAQADAVRVKLDDMQSKLEAASDDYYTALSQHDAAESKMEEAQDRIDDNNARIADLQDRLGGRARNMYRDGQTTFLDVVLGSATIDDFVKNWDALKEMNAQDADLVAETKALRKANEAEEKEYADQATLAQQKMDEADSIRLEAEKLVEQYQAEVDSLDAEVAALVEQERQAAAEAQAAQLAASFTPSSNEGSSSSTTSSSSSSSSSHSSNNANDDSDDSSSSKPSSSHSNSSGGGSSHPEVIDIAAGFIGVPYVWGGTTPAGFDCSGLTSYCYAQIGINIGRTTGAQYGTAHQVLPLSQALPGDVLYSGNHVGICTSAGGGEYIHAPRPGESVCYASWNLFYCALRW